MKYEIVDHGVHDEQRFPGCGVSLTGFTHVFTGEGCTAWDALDDAIEQASVDGQNVEHIVNELPDEPVTLPTNDCYYYVSIRM